MDISYSELVILHRLGMEWAGNVVFEMTSVSSTNRSLMDYVFFAYQYVAHNMSSHLDN